MGNERGNFFYLSICGTVPEWGAIHRGAGHTQRRCSVWAGKQRAKKEHMKRSLIFASMSRMCSFCAYR